MDHVRKGPLSFKIVNHASDLQQQWIALLLVSCFFVLPV